EVYSAASIVAESKAKKLASTITAKGCIGSVFVLALLCECRATPSPFARLRTRFILTEPHRSRQREEERLALMIRSHIVRNAGFLVRGVRHTIENESST